MYVHVTGKARESGRDEHFLAKSVIGIPMMLFMITTNRLGKFLVVRETPNTGSFWCFHAMPKGN